MANQFRGNAFELAEIAIAKVPEATKYKAVQLKVFAPSEAAPTSSAVPLRPSFSQWEPTNQRKPYWVVAPAGTLVFSRNVPASLCFLLSNSHARNGVR